MKKIKKIFLFFLIIIFVFFTYYKLEQRPVDKKDNKTYEVKIRNGMSGNEVLNFLKNKNLIRNKNIMKFKIKFNKNNSFKAGIYELKKSMTLDDIINTLNKGGKDIDTYILTIPEGYEIKQIANKMNDLGLSSDKFIRLSSNKEYFEKEFKILKELESGQSLEGYLFPTTYQVSKNTTEEDLIKMMLFEFEKEYNKEIKPLNKKNIPMNEVVTMASIVERESRRDDERAKIAAVFYNRISEGMNLQSCATVQYALGERKDVLTNKDTRIDSKYNTYKNKGLPPTPISSVGLKSLKAAIEPEDIDYLFFRTKEDGTGSHTFTKTYEEHLKAKPEN